MPYTYACEMLAGVQKQIATGKDTQQEDDLLHFEVKSLKAERRRYTCTLANAALIHIDI